MPVPLGSTACDVLLALIERAGALVTKDELIARVWKNLNVGNSTLYVHIRLLRGVLGSGYIVTRQGRGYQFVAEVRRTVSQRARTEPEPQRGNLPSLWISDAAEGPARLIGRREELGAVSDLLARARLVTLAGPGGVGKTSLALHAAGATSHLFPDGVWLVELATLSDPDLVPGAVATALGVKIGQSAAPLDTLVRQLGRKSMLIVLDNCEHVVSVAALLSEALLRATAGVKILVTSREPLCCIGEQIFEVRPLALPSAGTAPPAAIRATAAVELFLERSRSADPNHRMDDSDVSIAARICRRLDGLPLAIEMAAGWVGVLGLETLDTKLDGSLKGWLRAGSTAPPRHSTLRATLEWSHGLLSATEQRVLRRVAVFAGSFSMAAAEAVGSDGDITIERVFEDVAKLIRKSMIAVVPGSRAQRYRLLETTRAFMVEKLAAGGDCEATRRRHAEWMLRLLETAMREWETTGDSAWLERYAPVLDDLRAALDWSMEKDSDAAVALAGASWPLWRILALLGEGERRLSRAASPLSPEKPAALEARLRQGLGILRLNTTALGTAYEDLTTAATLYRALGESPHLGSVLATLGFALLMLGRIEEAEHTVAEALILLEHSHWPRTLAKAYSVQMCIELRRGDYDAVRSAGEKALRLCKLAGADFAGFTVSANLVEAALEKGDVDGAVSAGRELAAGLRETHNTDTLGFVLGVLCGALTVRGDLEEALAAAREGAPLLRDDGMLFGLFDHLALRAGLAGRTTDAALIAGYADSLYRLSGRPREPIGRQAIERLAVLLREFLPEDEIARLAHLGAQLSEDQALTLALSD
ncbi:MAG TPA: winged helix-turn-helix domain-containing protein [Rhizomicrobium sp.]